MKNTPQHNQGFDFHILIDWQAPSFLGFKDSELRPQTKSAKLYKREVKCAHAILDLGAPPHNYSPHIMKLDQFVRSSRDYDSIF